jgi:hypothetical protein
LIVYSRGGDAVFPDKDYEAEYLNRLSDLFFSNVIPTRDVLIQDLKKRNLILIADPQIQKLFNFLENPQKHSLNFCIQANELMKQILVSFPEFKKYEDTIQKLMAMRY